MGIFSSKNKNENEFPKIILDCQVWSNGSFGLFDYDTKHVTNESFLVEGPCRIVRNENILEICKITFNFDESKKKIISEIIFCQGHYWMYRVGDFEETLSSAFWINSKFLNYNRNKIPGSIINTGDILKIGKIILQVKAIEYKQNDNITEIDNPHHIDNLNESQSKLSNNVLLGEKGKELSDQSLASNDPVSPTCRICLSSSNSLKNPLINPCKCSGTMKFIHLNCLYNWLKDKAIFTKTNYSLILLWKGIECELCKEKLPIEVNSYGVTYNVYESEKPKSNYIILETPDFIKGINRVTIIMDFKERTILQLGREEDNEVKLLDVSVSKSHCTFTLHEHQVYMYDLGSKYGSLIKCEKPIRICPSAPVTVQIGNNLITANYESFVNKGCCNLMYSLH